MGEDYENSGRHKSAAKDGASSRRHHDDSEETESLEAKKSVGHYNKDSRIGLKGEKEHKTRDQESLKYSGSYDEKEKETKSSGKHHSSSRDWRKEDKDEYEKEKQRGKDRAKDADREKHREKDRDKDQKDRMREKEREYRRDKEHGKDGDRVRDNDREKNKTRFKEKNRENERDRRKDLEKEMHKESAREYGRERGKDAADRDKLKEKNRETEVPIHQETDQEGNRHGSNLRRRDGNHGRGNDIDKDGESLTEPSGDVNLGSDFKIINKEERPETPGDHMAVLELEERIHKMKEERLLKSTEGSSEVLAWVNRSRKIAEKKNSEKEKTFKLSMNFEEQDNMNEEESDDENQHSSKHLGGVKIQQHGLEKVAEGGAIVMTLKDHSILADGDVNQEVDVLENLEIGEQRRRDEAYKAAKKKTGIYDDKFSAEAVSEKKILPQYDDPVADELVTLDSSGHFSAEAERKLKELRKRIQGASTRLQGEDLNSASKASSDYYTEEEMIMKFNRPKKKKSLRKKEKLDLDVLEAEAKSAGLGSGDLGSRNNGKRQNLREAQDRIEAEMRSNAYQSAYAKANEASKALRLEKENGAQSKEEDDIQAFGDDDDELQKSLARARKIALKSKDEDEKSTPKLINLLSSASSKKVGVENADSSLVDQQENKVVFTEMEEFVWGLQLDEEEKRPKEEDVFMEEDEAPSAVNEEIKVEDSGWTEVMETTEDENPVDDKSEAVVDETIHEAAVGKGLAGALKLLKERGTLKETVEWGGRNMDKKKSKLSGINGGGEAKEIRIERTDEYGRT
ncbi:hypothetical protein M569_11517, partial [Genlisea aurea]